MVYAKGVVHHSIWEPSSRGLSISLPCSDLPWLRQCASNPRCLLYCLPHQLSFWPRPLAGQSSDVSMLLQGTLLSTPTYRGWVGQPGSSRAILGVTGEQPSAFHYPT